MAAHFAGRMTTIGWQTLDERTGIFQPLFIHEPVAPHLLHGPAVSRQLTAADILVGAFMIIDQQSGIARQVSLFGKIENDQAAPGRPEIGIVIIDQSRCAPAFDRKAANHQLPWLDEFSPHSHKRGRIGKHRHKEH